MQEEAEEVQENQDRKRGKTEVGVAEERQDRHGWGGVNMGEVG